jgi:hypothetical protein
MLQDVLFTFFLAGLCFVGVGVMFIFAGIVVIMRKRRIAEPIALTWVWFVLGILTIAAGAYLLLLGLPGL